MRIKLFSRKYKAGKRGRLAKLLHLKNHPFVVPVATFLLLFFATSIALVRFNSQIIQPSDSHIVIISHDKVKETLPTRAKTVGEFLQVRGIKLAKGDVIEPSKSTEIVEDNFRINIYRARPVNIIDNTKKIPVFTAALTPRSVAAAAGVKVYAEDNISVEPVDDVLKEGIAEKIVIDRATPVNLNLYGTKVVIRTHDKTVGDVLAEKKVELGKNDKVQPSASTVLRPNIQIFVIRSGTKITTVKETIDPPIEYVQDPTLSFGTTAVRQDGQPGKKLVTYQITLKNGHEISRKKIQEIVAQEPVKRIVARGQAIYIPKDKSVIMAAAGIPSSDYAYVNYIISRESGWCPTKLQGQIGYCPAFAPDSIPGYLGYGLGQATPGSKMSSFGSDWMTNPVTQLRWATSYAVGRYGSWEGAYNQWVSHSYW